MPVPDDRRPDLVIAVVLLVLVIVVAGVTALVVRRGQGSTLPGTPVSTATQSPAPSTR